MPELPEVEVLVRHLDPGLRNRIIRSIEVHRSKLIKPHSDKDFAGRLCGSVFQAVTRRGKYLVFALLTADRAPVTLIGHLGMTGRMYSLPAKAPLPRHTAVLLNLDRGQFVFEDTRYFGRLTLDTHALDKLGPEPWDAGFTVAYLRHALSRSRQAIKIKLLDQTLVAGIGNIYANEVLHRAAISPRQAAGRLNQAQLERLWRCIRAVLSEAIAWGSTVPLNWSGSRRHENMFYYGLAEGAQNYYEEKLRVYDRAGQPCPRCQVVIRRLVQAARSTYYCPACQTSGAAGKTIRAKTKVT